jgi:hypothetical protein
MMTLFSRVGTAVITLLLLVGSAFAQSTAAQTAKAAVVHTEISMKCSKEADAKGLHGKERKKFRSECKKTGAKPN